jgi:hypothetical protein
VRALCLALLVVAPLLSGAAAQETTESTLPSRAATFLWGFADGPTGRFADTWAYDGADSTFLDGCLLIQVDPDQDRGIITAAGWINEETQIIARLGLGYDATGDERQGGLARDVKLDGTFGRHGVLPSIPARLAGWGNATLEIDGVPYDDPVTGGAYKALFFQSDRAVREPDTGLLYGRDGTQPFDPFDPAGHRPGAKRSQAHLVLRNGTEGRASPANYLHTGGVQDPLFPLGLSEPQRFRHGFFNLRYGGEATTTFTIRSATNTLVGSQFNLTVRDPSGAEVARASLGGTAGPTESTPVTYALDRFGTYDLIVEGGGPAVSYSLATEARGPDEILLQFWWTDLVHDDNARRRANECRQRVDGLYGDAALQPPTGQHPPRLGSMNVLLLVVGVVGTIAVVLFATKLILDQRESATLVRMFSKR